MEEIVNRHPLQDQPGEFLDRHRQPGNIRMTSVEIGILWMQYLSDSMVSCMLKVFLSKVADDEIRPVVEYALNISVKHLQAIESIFGAEGLPLPKGFTDQDINLDAPRLYSDPFALYYIKAMAKAAVQTYGLSLAVSAKQDVRQFFHDCVSSSAKLDEKVTGVLLTKGLYIRPPYIWVQDHVDRIKKNRFLGSVFGSQRKANGVEIMHLFVGAQTAMLGKALFIGFSQVARKQKVRDFFIRGKGIASKHIDVFNEFLTMDDLPGPVPWDTEATNSTTAPFSDKLMLFQSVFLVESVVGNFGVAIGSCMRKDIILNFMRFLGELSRYAEDGVKLSIANGWMEEPPHALDRPALAKGLH